MCDERERLIEYLYGESEPDERRLIDAHLADCHLCRSEVNGLRAVRNDLLAWDVPQHEPVWRPLAPAVPAATGARHPWWQMAAAAVLIFAAGLAGGITARSWRADPPSAQVHQAAVAPVAPVVVSAVDRASIEAAILERVRQEIDEKVRAVSLNQPTASSPEIATATPDLDLVRRVAAIEDWVDDQISLNAVFNGQFGRLNRQAASLSQELEISRLQQVGLQTGAR
jgi:anti-sigma factor RsiW